MDRAGSRGGDEPATEPKGELNTMARPRKVSTGVANALGQQHASGEAKAVFTLVQRHQLTVQDARDLIRISDHERAVLASLFPAANVQRIVEFRAEVLQAFEKLCGTEETK